MLAMAMLLVVLTTEASPPNLIQSQQAQPGGDQPIASAVKRNALAFLHPVAKSVMAIASLIEALEGVAGLDQEKFGISKQYVQYLKDDYRLNDLE